MLENILENLRKILKNPKNIGNKCTKWVELDNGRSVFDWGGTKKKIYQKKNLPKKFTKKNLSKQIYQKKNYQKTRQNWWHRRY